MNAPLRKAPFNPGEIRKQFPILARRVNDRPLVYLDNAASAQKPEAVIAAMAGAMRGAYANVHRGIHTLANETTQAFEDARAAVARFINAPSAESIVFTKGATAAINIVAGSLAGSIRPGDEIVLSVMEHHSNIVPWHFLRERHGAALKWLDIDADGGFDLASLDALITPRTRMIALTHCSNVLGARTPAREIAAIAAARGIPLLLDGCQAIVHEPVDVQALGADYYVFSGHKLYGPTGIGVLYGKPERLAAMAPFEGGGEMIEEVSLERITYNDPPHRFEAGTPPIIEAIGLHAAIDFVNGLDRPAALAHERALRDRAMAQLSAMNDVHLYGRAADKAAIVAFNLAGAHPHDVAQILDKHGVAIRAGHHCAQPLMDRFDLDGTTRVSIAPYNDNTDIDALLTGVQHAAKTLR
jgi:cysteine desulfurase/selenocysteine lyase